jgi:hypothetical protein
VFGCVCVSFLCLSIHLSVHQSAKLQQGYGWIFEFQLEVGLGTKKTPLDFGIDQDCGIQGFLKESSIL